MSIRTDHITGDTDLLLAIRRVLADGHVQFAAAKENGRWSLSYKEAEDPAPVAATGTIDNPPGIA